MKKFIKSFLVLFIFILLLQSCSFCCCGDGHYYDFYKAHVLNKEVLPKEEHSYSQTTYYTVGGYSYPTTTFYHYVYPEAYKVIFLIYYKLKWHSSSSFSDSERTSYNDEYNKEITLYCKDKSKFENLNINTDYYDFNFSDYTEERQR
jgi:hypothetical protein